MKNTLFALCLCLAACSLEELQQGLKTGNDMVVVAEKCELTSQAQQNEKCLELPTKEQAEECIMMVTKAHEPAFSVIDEWRRFRCLLELGPSDMKAVDQCVENAKAEK